MSVTVETRDYVDGDGILHAQIRDNGTVRFSGFVKGDVIPGKGMDVTRGGAISSTVLRQLADLADAANGKLPPDPDASVTP